MSGPSTPGQQQVDADRRAIGPWQTWLEQFCTTNGIRPPIYSIASDRRGGRTAWSAAVEVNGTGYTARYWYDGNYITNAKEDAAQVCLERLEPPAEHQQHQLQYGGYSQQLQAQQAQTQPPPQQQNIPQEPQQQQQHQQQQLPPPNQGDMTQQGQGQNMWQSYGR